MLSARRSSEPVSKLSVSTQLNLHHSAVVSTLVLLADIAISWTPLLSSSGLTDEKLSTSFPQKPFQQLLFKDCLASYTQANEQPRYETKDCQVAIVAYHLMSVPVDNTGQPLLSVWGFLRLISKVQLCPTPLSSCHVHSALCAENIFLCRRCNQKCTIGFNLIC